MSLGGKNETQKLLHRSQSNIRAWVEAERVSRLLLLDYTDLRELTPEVLRTFIERIIIHERTAKHSKSATQQIDIYFRYIGKLMPEEVA